MKPPVVNPYAKKKAKKGKETTWNHRWHQTATSNDRKSKRKVTTSPNSVSSRIITVSPNVDQIGGSCYFEAPPAGTIMPHPSNPTFFLPTQHASSEEETDSEDKVEVARRISLSPTPQSQIESPEKIEPKKRAPITATITFHDDDFLEGIVQRVSENIGDLMLSYYASKKTSSV